MKSICRCDRATYQVDLAIGVCPQYDASAIFAVRKVSRNRRLLGEAASARLDPESMRPSLERGDAELLARVFAAWSERHPPAAEYLRELRARTRERGRELREIIESWESIEDAVEAAYEPTADEDAFEEWEPSEDEP